MYVDIKCPYCSKESGFNADSMLEILNCTDCNRDFVVELKAKAIVYIQAKLSQADDENRLDDLLAEYETDNSDTEPTTKKPGPKSKQISPEVAKYIKEHCKETGKKQRQIAFEIGIEPTMFNKILRDCRAGEDNINRVLEYYHSILPTEQYTEARS